MGQHAYRGCLLGMAVGDAMGYTVDSRSWQEIQEDYGPNGLLGYDLCNGTGLPKNCWLCMYPFMWFSSMCRWKKPTVFSWPGS